MTPSRNSTGLSGILALDKPQGMTSHDVVGTVRRLTGERRVGHAGTLDPLATGLLLVCVGPATRLADYLMIGTKTYEARVCFGAQTTTDDQEGEILFAAELPQQLEDAAFAAQTLREMCGRFEQVPPAFSAIKKQGVTAYKAARAGKPLELEPRPVELYDALILEAGKDFWDVRLTVSKGFYVRSFARDLGRALGSAAHLGALRRTASGCVTIEQACELANLPEQQLGQLPFLDPVIALGYPMIEVDSREAQSVQNGRPLALTACSRAAQTVVSQTGARNNLISVVSRNRFLALYKPVGSSGLFQPEVVISAGIDRLSI